MELSLLKIYRITKKVGNKSFRALPVPDSFNLYIILFYNADFLSLPLWKYTDRVSTKYWPKLKNFIFVNSEVISIKNKISCFDPGSPFPSGYPNAFGIIWVFYWRIYLIREKHPLNNIYECTNSWLKFKAHGRAKMRKILLASNKRTY